MYDMLVNYKMQTPFEKLATNKRQPKQIVIENKTDINRKAKASRVMMGKITDLGLNGIRQGLIVLDGICQSCKSVIR